ncbi:GMC oxidoreductase [Ramaria rubella]|nr:GMC oxidoreductase [Ramaria rubella]
MTVIYIVYTQVIQYQQPGLILTYSTKMVHDTAPSFCNRRFDYVIVGGGTAGLALAARLSEDPKVIVGVLEAGEWEKNSAEITTPGLALSNMANPKFDWSFISVPQSQVNKRPIFQSWGKGLGGSSLLNSMILSRASSGEYDAMEKLGNPGWNWTEFLKYMKKSETTLPPDPDLAGRYGIDPPDYDFHGDSGPIVKTHPTWSSDIEWPLISTINSLGVPNNPDAGKGDNVGVAISFSSIDRRTATRSYAANAYYEPNSQRQNLSLVTGAHVIRIILERDTKEGILSAAGVEFVKDGQNYTATANREVILSAGSLQTPQLLELSGIGRKDVLSQFGIQQVVDLPGVGENLRDHIMVEAIHEIDSALETLDVMSDDLSREKQVKLYKTQQGLLASPPCICLAFIPTTSIAPGHKLKEWETAIDSTINDISLNASAPTGLKKQYELQKGWLSDTRYAQAEILSLPGFFSGPGKTASPGSHYSSMTAALMHPFSRGTVHISSRDPLAPPAIDPRYFSNPQDLDVLLHAFKFMLTLYETQPLAGLVRSRVIPTKEDTASDETMREYIKNHINPVFHPIGTASMLPREDGGVVDASLRVYGTANLRVVDCSVVPLHLSCHTQTIAYAIGEKAADMIKSSYN